MILPVRNGVSPSRVCLPRGPWKTVLEFLGQRFMGVGTSTWSARMRRGDVVDERGVRVAPDAAYRAGALLYYYRDLPHEPHIPFEESVLYRDEHLLVVDKPGFLPVVPAGRFVQETLLVRLRRALQLDFLAPVHRLDRETSGVVLFALSERACAAYSGLFARRNVRKTYEAWAGPPRGRFPCTHRSRLVRGEPFFRMREITGPPNAETHIELLEERAAQARYRLTPVTGRKHQLRVHMAALGMPIVNDALYPALAPRADDDFARPLQLLAQSLTFVDPLNGATRYFASRQTLRGY